MIYLKQNQINDVVFTLNEKNQLTGVTSAFTFIFLHTDTNTNVTFTGTDVSTCPNRYNRFLITTTGATSVNLSASTINVLGGFHNYTVTNISGSTLETGIVMVSGATTPVPVYEVPVTKTKIVYER